MTYALILFGVLSLLLVYYWQKRIGTLDSLFTWFQNRYGNDSIDLSGQTQYTRCISHDWAMQNVVRKRHSKRGEALQAVLMDNTLAGTMIGGLILGASSLIIVLLLFQSFVLAGETVFVIVAAVYLLWGSGSVETSYNFLTWLAEQESEFLKVGDLAYAEISRRAIVTWQRTLAVIGTVSILFAPWGNLVMDGLAIGIATFYQGFLNYIFLPVAAFSFVLALLLLIGFLPLVFGILYYGGKSLRRKIGRRTVNPTIEP
ncbi:MAG: hypothetical protein ACW97O_12185 [Candidatus Thorarchaeota archaeon]|jgi:hypothetical protein